MSDRTLWERVSEGIGRADLLVLGDRLEILETAVREELTLLDVLARQVDELERVVVPVLEADEEAP